MYHYCAFQNNKNVLIKSQTTGKIIEIKCSKGVEILREID